MKAELKIEEEPLFFIISLFLDCKTNFNHCK